MHEYEEQIKKNLQSIQSLLEKTLQLNNYIFKCYEDIIKTAEGEK